MTNEEEENTSVFKKIIKRTKYSMALLGVFSHSCVMQLFYSRSGADKSSMDIFMRSDLLALIISFVLCAALIETSMLILDRRLR